MKVLFRSMLVFAALGLWAQDAHAEISARVISYGIYEYEAPLLALPGSATSVGSTDNAKLVTQTSTIKHKIGTMFGFIWVASGFAEGEPLQITYRIKHPAMRMPGEEVSTGADEIFLVNPVSSTYEMASAFQFSEPHELVAGEWEMTVLINGTQVASKIFRVH